MKDCSTCKYKSYPILKEPCKSCVNNDNYKEK